MPLARGCKWKQTLVRTGAAPEGIGLSPDERELWAAQGGDGGVSIIDVNSRKVVQTLDAGTQHSDRLRFTPNGRWVLIADDAGGELVIFDAKQRTQKKRLTLGSKPKGIVISPDSTRAYIALNGDDQIAVIDLKKLTVISKIPTGHGPDGLAWAP